MPKAPASPHTHGRSEVRQRAELKEAVASAQRQLGTRLRALRTELEWNQETAAEKVGIHAKYLSRIEGGAANPSLAVLVALARAYGVELSALLS